MFRKRRLGLRYIALAALVAGMSWSFISNEQPAPMVPGQAVLASAPESVSAPVIAPAHQDFEVLNLKEAFDSKPAAPSYQFSPADEAAAPKPKIVASPLPAPILPLQLTYIQSGITRILEGDLSPAPAPAADTPEEEKKLQVGKGDTLMELLVRNAVPREQAYNAIMALKKVYDPRDLNPSHEVTVFFHRDPSVADPKFVGLRIDRDSVNSLVVNRGDDGSFSANQQAKAVHKETRAFRGRIDSSLYVDAKKAGVPDSVIFELIKMYSWGVDFQRELQRGDEFEVMYEQYVTDDGRVVPNKGEIVYANMNLSERKLPLYRFEDARGDTEYFDPSGQSAKKPLMKTPIDGARLTSKFGMRRHPILGYNKMHKGIDFAAPRGTPIYAAGDGVIEKAGRAGGYGKYIRIRHRAGLSTAYGHLNGFKAGIKPGTRVKQGQVIGYVGTTGRSTGPHLHYEILMAGKQVNPATIKVSGGRALAGKELKSFKEQVGKMDVAFGKALGPLSSGMVAKAE